MKPTWMSTKNIKLGELEIEQIIQSKIHQNNNTNDSNNNNTNDINNNFIIPTQLENERLSEEKKESKKYITITIPESTTELNLPNQGHSKFNNKIHEPREKPNRRYSLPAGINQFILSIIYLFYQLFILSINSFF